MSTKTHVDFKASAIGEVIPGHRLIPQGMKEQVCKLCGKAMLIAKGQIAKYHKECRKNRSTYQPLIARSK